MAVVHWAFMTLHTSYVIARLANWEARKKEQGRSGRSRSLCQPLGAWGVGVACRNAEKRGSDLLSPHCRNVEVTMGVW
jgi:hypothetical protein